MIRTPIGQIKAMARRYSKKFKVPIVISAKKVEEAFEDAEAMYSYRYTRKGRIVGTIYLHPNLKHTSSEHVDSTILHEIAHMKVEKDWEDKP